MELPSKILERIAVNTRPKNEKHTLIVTDKSTHEEHLSQLLQTINKQFKIAITFLSGNNGIFIVTKKLKIFFTVSIIDDEFTEITIPTGASELQYLNNEIKIIIIEEGHFTEVDYPFHIKPKSLTLGSIIENSTQGPLVIFSPSDSIRNFLGFN